jgi:hypothetical protein
MRRNLFEFKIILSILIILCSSFAQASLLFKFYGVSTTRDGTTFGYPKSLNYEAEIVSRGGQLFAEFQEPVIILDPSSNKQVTITKIEIDHGHSGQFHDLVLFLNSLSPQEVFLFPDSPAKIEKQTKDNLLETGQRNALQVKKSVKYEDVVRRLTYTLVDVDLNSVMNGILLKPNLRPMFEAVYASKGDTHFFGIERGSRQLDLESLAKILNDTQILSLDDESIRSLLDLQFSSKVEHELKAPWGERLRNILVDSHSISRVIGPGNAGTPQLNCPRIIGLPTAQE